jgi:hypothetical protein
MNSCVSSLFGTRGSSGRWKGQVMATSEERVIHTKSMNEETPLSWVANGQLYQYGFLDRPKPVGLHTRNS